MITHPKPEELTEAVTRWIEQIRPQLDARDGFLSRVAVNALRAVARELSEGEAAKAAATARMSALMQREDSYEGLTRELCARIRRGELGVQTPGLVAALRQNVLDQLAIDQPGYRHEA